MVIGWHYRSSVVSKTMEKITVEYSTEQLKRKAHLNKMGTLAGYNRDHYPKELKEKRNNDNK